MSLASIQHLPPEVTSQIVGYTLDPALCSRVCKNWYIAVNCNEFGSYEKVFHTLLKNSAIALVISSQHRFVQEPTNEEAKRLVRLTAYHIMVEVNRLGLLPTSATEVTLSKMYPIFEDVENIKLINYLACWNKKVESYPANATAPLPQCPALEGELKTQADTIRKWMIGFPNNLKTSFGGEAFVRDLDLSQVNLENLPPEFYLQYHSVHTIDLSNNSLKLLPSGISQCISLTEIYLGGNPIESLSRELCLCPSLSNVWIDEETRERAEIPEEVDHFIVILPSPDDDDAFDDRCSMS